MKRLVAAAVGAAALFGVSVSSATAAPLTWYLSGATFADGGIATGSYIFDADFGTFSGISVTTSGGSSGIAGTTYNYTTTFAAPDAVDLTTGTGDLTGLPNLYIVLYDAMTNLGGTIAIATFNGGEQICLVPNCENIDILRSFTAGSVTTINPVPLPAGAWLLLSALGGLGLAGWRRRKAVAA